MREIKFRAWDVNTKEMYYDTRFCMQAIADERYAGYGEDLELMQYTGLKDKTGKEVYEGDVVHYRYDYEGNNYWEVKWEYDGWKMVRGERVTGDQNCSDDSHYNDWKEVEIIGNIYENSELLK